MPHHENAIDTAIDAINAGRTIPVDRKVYRHRAQALLDRVHPDSGYTLKDLIEDLKSSIQ